ALKGRYFLSSICFAKQPGSHAYRKVVVCMECFLLGRICSLRPAVIDGDSHRIDCKEFAPGLPTCFIRRHATPNNKHCNLRVNTRGRPDSVRAGTESDTEVSGSKNPGTDGHHRPSLPRRGY